MRVNRKFEGPNLSRLPSDAVRDYPGIFASMGLEEGQDVEGVLPIQVLN